MADHYRSVRFDPALHDAGAFDSSEPTLDGWLRQHAANEDWRDHSRISVWIDNAGRVVGYYALSAHRIAREELPMKLGRGGPREAPAILIGKLALDRTLRGTGVGVVLLADALDRCVNAAAIASAKFAVANALHEAVAVWYERVGFVRVPESLVLVRSIRNIAYDRDQQP